MSELEIGVKVEMEHEKTIREILGSDATDDKVKAVAQKIAEDHLKEDDKYYTKLKAAKL